MCLCVVYLLFCVDVRFAHNKNTRHETYEHKQDISNPCSTAEVKTAVTSAVPEAEMLSDAGTEVVFRLPLHASKQFSALFESLDAHIARKTLGIASYTISGLLLPLLFEFFCG